MRKEGWEGMLAQYLRESANLSFEWGWNDCAIWVARWVDRATGSDHINNWLGFYDSESSAIELLAEHGFTSIEGLADSILMMKPLMQASRGDIVLHPEKSATGALGICDGRRSYFLNLSGGITPVETLKCRKAWGV